MTAEGSITRWLMSLQAGDRAAVERLWERYFRRLVGLARRRLVRAPHQIADGEDVALSAFDSFCRHAANGRFPHLQDRDGLWRLLATITARKVAHVIRDETRRTGGVTPIDISREEVLSRQPTPEMAAEVGEECQRLLRRLGDPELEMVALLRMEGHSVEEIGERIGYAARSVKRKLQMIRTIWEGELTRE